MLITLVRHGEVDEKYHKKYYGHLDISLSHKGKRTAQLLANKLSTKHYDAVYCSDLKRCRETLEPFHFDVPVRYSSRLREKSWGRHEGKSFDEIIEMEEFEYENFEQWLHALDGERFDSFIRGVKSFFQEFLLEHSYKNILVMTHAGVIRVLISIIQNISLEEAFSTPLDYASYILLDTESWKFSEVQKV